MTFEKIAKGHREPANDHLQCSNDHRERANDDLYDAGDDLYEFFDEGANPKSIIDQSALWGGQGSDGIVNEFGSKKMRFSLILVTK